MLKNKICLAGFGQNFLYSLFIYTHMHFVIILKGGKVRFRLFFKNLARKESLSILLMCYPRL